MDVNAKKIKLLRTSKGWTQQHLADACIVSLRTIQRVERYGNASNDTLLGLCSVLEVNTADILVCDSDITLEDAPIKKNENVNFFSLTVAMSIGMFTGSFITWLIVTVL